MANENVSEEFVTNHMVDATLDLVWPVFIKCEHLKNWWGPKGYAMRECKLAFHPEGIFHYSLQSPDGSIMWGKFVYKEIETFHKIIFISSFADEKGVNVHHPMSPTWPLEVYNTLEFSEKDGKTTITIHSHPINASEIEIKTFNDGHGSMTQGFSGTWEQLDEYIKKIKQ